MNQDQEPKKPSNIVDEYPIPEDRDEFLDVNQGKIIDKKDIKPFDIIKAWAKKFGTPICEPNSGCHKCYGRGYSGFDSKTKAPIPCGCIFRKNNIVQKSDNFVSDQKYNGWNRAKKRKMMKISKNTILKNKREMIKDIENKNSEKTNEPEIKNAV